MRRIRVNLKEKGYDILIKRGLCDTLGEEIKAVFTGSRVFVLTDKNVGSLYLEKALSALSSGGFDVKSLSLVPGERTKSLSALGRVYEALLDSSVTRSDLVLTLGGGVIGDLGGFAASTYLRGVKFAQVPTSLLAQVDSSIGGKTGVNLKRGKNLVGSFYQPALVLIDPDFLGTLPDKYFSDGMAEVVKTACIRDESLFSGLSALAGRDAFAADAERIIEACCLVKKQLVEADEFDTGDRMLLNFGHTIGHAIEQRHGFRTFTHGQAVAAGMAAITRISENRGLTEKGTANRMETLLARFGLPDKAAGLSPGDLIPAIGLDKKNLGGTLKVVLLKRIGESFLYETTPEFFKGEHPWGTSSLNPPV